MEIFLPSKVTNALDTPKENDLEAKGTEKIVSGMERGWRENEQGLVTYGKHQAPVQRIGI